MYVYVALDNGMVLTFSIFHRITIYLKLHLKLKAKSNWRHVKLIEWVWCLNKTAWSNRDVRPGVLKMISKHARQTKMASLAQTSQYVCRRPYHKINQLLCYKRRNMHILICDIRLCRWIIIRKFECNAIVSLFADKLYVFGIVLTGRKRFRNYPWFN